ncbi:MAG: ATP-binding cassette domain-containing protein [bacterium]|nr:ATP-binding cassette domain-containing protein [Candidatus Minthenecus merdequi]
MQKSIDNITVSGLLPLVFRGMEATDRISNSNVWLVPELVFGKGCRVCIQAESGSGKTSLLNFIFGARRDYVGDIRFNGQDIRNLSINDWCRVRQFNIAMLPQELNLFPELTVMQNLRLKNNITNHKSESQIMDMLERLGIKEKADVRVEFLSVGQQQRVALIRSICQPFDFIMLDEPVSHLDLKNNVIIARMIEEEATAQGAGIISTSVGNPLLLANARQITL